MRRQKLFNIALGLYALSLVLPALVMFSKPLFGGGGQVKSMLGIHCLAIGFFMWPGWVANPLVFVAWIFMATARGRAAYFAAARWLALFAIVSAVLAPFLLVSGGMLELRSPHVGYFAWLASIVLTAVAAHLAKLDADDAALT